MFDNLAADMISDTASIDEQITAAKPEDQKATVCDLKLVAVRYQGDTLPNAIVNYKFNEKWREIHFPRRKLY